MDSDLGETLDDIELDEAGRNWLRRNRKPPAAQGELRRLAADAALTADIGRVYEVD